MTSAVAAANDGYVIVTSGGRDDLYRVDVFSEKGKRICKFQVESSYHYPQATFHQVSGHVVVAGIEKQKSATYKSGFTLRMASLYAVLRATKKT